jgi:hydrogenase maturation protease
VTDQIQSQTTDQILVACIGNIFFGDDGFGVEVARALAAAPLPAAVKVIDYGIRGLDLAYALLDPWSAVILVDAVARGGKPGTLYTLEPQLTEDSQSASLDPHALDPVRVIRCARSLGEVNARIYIVACEPQDLGDELEGRMELSPAIEAAIPGAVRMVRDLIATISQVAEPAEAGI